MQDDHLKVLNLVAALVVSSAMTKGTAMSVQYRSEIRRGLKESSSSIETLRSLWPMAFPKKSHLVKPLALKLDGRIAERTGWNIHYTRGVLIRWKAQAAYCYAILGHDRRFNLEGEATEQMVDDTAREMARQQLARIAMRRAETKRRKAAEAAKQEPEISDSAASAAG